MAFFANWKIKVQKFHKEHYMKHGLLTGSGCQIYRITDEVVGDSKNSEGVFDARHQIADEYSFRTHGIVVIGDIREVAAFTDVLRSGVLGIVHRPPLYHVRLDSALWARILECHVRRIDNRRYVQHWIWT